MSAEKELEEWLNRKEKTFAENLQFAIKLCRSLEFALQTKYEIALKWFSEKFAAKKDVDVSLDVLLDLVSLSFPQHLVQSATKESFVQAITDHVNSLSTNSDSRVPIELLLKLAEHQSFQFFYGSNRSTYIELQRTIFSRYITYFQSKPEFYASAEVSFFHLGLAALKSFIWTRGDKKDVKKHSLVRSLIEASLFLTTEKSVYNEVLEILRMMNSFWMSAFSAPLHVAMYCMDFAINENRVGSVSFMGKLLTAIESDKSPPKLSLYRTAHILDLLRKYDVDVDKEVSTDKTTMMNRLTAYIEEKVAKYSESNPKEVLMLLCSAIRLRPMSLEKIMFRITVQFMLRHKTDNEWNCYVEYLILIIDVFRKLGRAEKLVSYLIKSLKGQLELTGLSNSLKRRVSREPDGTPRKLRKTEQGAAVANPASQISPINEQFISILREEFATKHSAVERSSKWKNIYMAWPHENVGKYFTGFVTTLMSRPSLVLWKTLIFSLGDSIKALRNAPTDEKSLTMIDFNSALLCEYLSGSRLPEQTDKFWNEIKESRDIMENLLRDFGEMLLECEHNNRTMDAFLEICQHVGYFDLAMAYYCPETQHIGTPDLHSYMSKEQWVSLEQRIVNFGNSGTKQSINQLHLQKMQLNLLYQNEKKSSPNDVRRYLLSETLDDSKLLKGLFQDKKCSWLFKFISKDDKRKICYLLMPENGEVTIPTLQNLLEDSEFLEFIVLRFFELMSACFDSKKAILMMARDECTTEAIRDAIQAKIGGYSIKHCDTERLKYLVRIVLEHVPIGFCATSYKTKVFALSLALYRDAMAIKDDEIVRLGFDMLSKIIHFGSTVDIFKFFDIEILAQILPPTRFEEFYLFIFDSPTIWTKNTEAALSKLLDRMKGHRFELSDDEVLLAITLLERRCNVVAIKPVLRGILHIMMEYIKSYFASSFGKKEENDKAFVRKTAAILPLFLNHIHATNKDLVEFDEDIKDIYRKYVILSRNDDIYSHLINEARFFRNKLGFGDAELEVILQEMWKQLLIDVKKDDYERSKCERILKSATSHQTTEQFIEMFSHIEESLSTYEACKILLCLIKCDLSPHQGSVINSCCHILLFNKILSFEKTEKGPFADSRDVLSVLQVLEAICERKKFELSSQFIDDMLVFLVDIRIRHYSVEEGEEARKTFYEIYKRMIRVCAELIYCRSGQTLSRVPQFVYVFRELLQALVTYRSDRLKVSALETDELEQLATLAHELENLMHGMAKHAPEMKRVAPFLLTYTINAMVVNSRSTVRFPRIKLHVENICYKLIPLCDYRVKSFILRCSNDATRQIYENLCKDHEKYQKFKGKV